MSRFLNFVMIAAMAISIGACSSNKGKLRAQEAAARYWQDKAYPGKAHDVQVTEAEDAGDGLFRVKGIVDGETRVGTFNPETETFSEGYYSLAKERDKRIAELEQEGKYWKEKFEKLEKEHYKLRVKLESMETKTGKKADTEKTDQ